MKIGKKAILGKFGQFWGSLGKFGQGSKLEKWKKGTKILVVSEEEKVRSKDTMKK